MTREEIRKALECCSDESLVGRCAESPLIDKELCLQVLHQEALDYITKEDNSK